MSESEDLKASADRIRSQEKVAAMSAYIDILISRSEEAVKRDRDAFIIYNIVWICWVLSNVLNTGFGSLFEIFFVMALIYSSLRQVIRARANGEFKGCIKTLEILGMIPPIDPPGDTENKKQVWSEGVDIVKGWFKKKEKAQEDAYAPA